MAHDKLALLEEEYSKSLLSESLSSFAIKTLSLKGQKLLDPNLNFEISIQNENLRVIKFKFSFMKAT